MRLLQKSTWPRVPGGQKLQPVPYPIYRSRIAINIERSLIPLENQNIECYRISFFFVELIFFIVTFEFCYDFLTIFLIS